MIIACPTVPHTGSYFVVKHLFKGFEHVLFNQEPKEENVIYFDHMFPHKRESIEGVCEKHPVIIPIRHPKVCALSWERRNRELDDMCQMFREMVNVYDKYNPFYIPLDTDLRDDALNSINKELMLKLTTQWKPVHSKREGSKSRFTDSIELKEGKLVEELIEEIQPFLDRFYI